MLTRNEIENGIAANTAIINELKQNYTVMTELETLADIDAQMTVKRIENNILKDNARRAIYNEVMPIALEVWNKYEGKPLGEKTTEKICSEIKKRLDGRYSFYIARGNDQFSIAPLNEKGFSGQSGYSYNDFNISLKFDHTAKKWLTLTNENNKINRLTLDNLRLDNCGEYIDNPEETATALLEEYREIKEARAKLEEQIKAFDKRLPSKYGYISISQFRDYLF